MLLVLGLIAAVLLFIQQPIADYLDKSEAADADISKSEKQQEKETSYNILAYEVLIPVAQFNLFHSFDLLIELPVPEEAAKEQAENISHVFDGFLETLFTRITTPNAP